MKTLNYPQLKDYNTLPRTSISEGIHLVQTRSIYKADGGLSSKILLKLVESNREGHTTPFIGANFRQITSDEQKNGLTFYIKCQIKISEDGASRKQFYFYGTTIQPRTFKEKLLCIKSLFWNK